MTIIKTIEFPRIQIIPLFPIPSMSIATFRITYRNSINAKIIKRVQNDNTPLTKNAKLTSKNPHIRRKLKYSVHAMQADAFSGQRTTDAPSRPFPREPNAGEPRLHSWRAKRAETRFANLIFANGLRRDFSTGQLRRSGFGGSSAGRWSGVGGWPTGVGV